MHPDVMRELGNQRGREMRGRARAAGLARRIRKEPRRRARQPSSPCRGSRTTGTARSVTRNRRATAHGPMASVPVTGGAFRRFGADTAEFKRIWTDSGYRRRGYAKALLEREFAS